MNNPGASPEVSLRKTPYGDKLPNNTFKEFIVLTTLISGLYGCFTGYLFRAS